MKAPSWRLALALLILPITLGLIYVRPYRRLACNETLLKVERSTKRIVTSDSSWSVASQARENLAMLQPCESVVPTVVMLPVLRANNLVVLGRYAEARDAWRAALQVDRRPELYLYLGQTELLLGDVRSAEENLIQAVLARDDYQWELDASMREAVVAEVRARRRSMPPAQKRDPSVTFR